MYRRLNYYKAICLKENHGDYNGAKIMLLRLLGAIEVNDVYDYLNSRICDEIEVNICNAIAVNEAYKGNERIALELLIYLDNNIQRYNVVCLETVSKIKYNIVRKAYDVADYSKAIKYAKENITICKKNKLIRYLAGTYMYLANAMKALEPESNYLLYYQKFIYLSYFLDDSDKMKKAIDEVISKNEITLDDRIILAEL